ncbi:MAG: hypothetical protein ACP5SD_06555 [Elusimicrobiales bacterium]
MFGYFILILLFCSNLFSLSDDNFYNTYSLAYSNTLLDFPLKSNPATYGNIRNITADISYLNQNYALYGESDSENKSFNFFLPKISYGKNLTYTLGYEKNEFKNLKANIFNFGGASYHILDFGEEYLDFGINYKKLKLEGINDFSFSKAFIDIGLLARKKDYLFALSFLNFNSSFADKNNKIDIPKVRKFSVTRLWDEFSLGFDFTMRNSDIRSSYNMGVSFSQLWRTYRYGYFKTATSLTIGDKKDSLGLGIFYNRDVWELGYSLSFSLNNPAYFNNAVSIAIYWGRRDVETDYEKIIKREVKYRKDLMEELVSANKREEKLKGNIAKMQAEIDELIFNMKKLEEKLKNKDAEKTQIESEKENIRKTLESLIERQRKNQEEIKNIEEKRRLERIKLAENEFNKDFDNYLKLKSQGVGKEVLVGYLKKIITQYQSENIDISRATIELQRLLKQ